MEELITYQNPAQHSEPLPAQDYTMELLRRCALDGALPDERLLEIRTALQQAVAERAAAYTKGRSGTVTKAQAEAFYISLFSQLDVALLELHSDQLAVEALRTQPVSALLSAGQLRTLQLYEEAKNSFRRAYQLTEPFQTSFFHELLSGFSEFCTQYDARFRADDVKVEYIYPLLGDRQITQKGVLGVHQYYLALMHEGEFLQHFPADQIHTLMERYAARFLTKPAMIAENIADLVFRHWIAAALLGSDACTVQLPPDTGDQLPDAYAGSTEADLLREMQSVLLRSVFAENKTLLAALPVFAETMHARIAERNLQGWLVF